MNFDIKQGIISAVISFLVVLIIPHSITNYLAGGNVGGGCGPGLSYGVWPLFPFECISNVLVGLIVIVYFVIIFGVLYYVFDKKIKSDKK